jgi:hypothetical protein
MSVLPKKREVRNNSRENGSLDSAQKIELSRKEPIRNRNSFSMKIQNVKKD